ncbi:MAG TPA: DMT family transporter [Nitrososphaerales archaeon]
MSLVQSKTSTSGYLYGLGSAVTAGLIPVLSKLSLVSVRPLTVSALVFFAAGLMLLVYHPKERPGKKSAGWMLVTGMLGAAIAPALYLYGINQTSAVNAALLTTAEVFFTGVIAFVVFKETLKQRQLLESLIVVAGIIIVSTGLDFSSVQLAHGLAGNLLVLAAGLVWAVDNNLSRVTSQKFGPVFVSKFRNIFGGGLLLVFLVATSALSPVPTGAVPVLILYAADIAVATLTFTAALVRIGAVRTLLAFSTTSIFGSVFSVAILGEALTIVQVTGGALILLGVYLIQKSENR